MNEQEWASVHNCAPCSVVVVDNRVVVADCEGDVCEYGLAIAYGENITDEFGGMLAPPNLEGDFVLSLHNVEVTGGALSVVDQWMDARPCEPDLDHEQAIAAAAQWLAEMDDDYYLLIAGYSPGQDQLRHDGSSVKFTSHVLGR